MNALMRTQFAENLASRVLVQANRINPEVFHRVSLYDRVALTQMFESLLNIRLGREINLGEWGDKMSFSAVIKKGGYLK